MNNIVEGHGNLVVMPTGSGKTLIPEFAIWLALKNHSPERPVRVVYTLPRVAVLGEKFEKFKARYGAKNIGLMTGQETQNRQAPILLMTTEVWDKILATATENLDLLHSVRFVTHDEIHFLADVDRGSHWETVITLTPNWMQSTYMSASVGNPEEMNGWLNDLRKLNQKRKTILPELNTPPAHLQGSPALLPKREVKLVQSFERPVPLRRLFLGLSRENKTTLTEIFERESNTDRLKHKIEVTRNKLTGMEEKLKQKQDLQRELTHSQDAFFQSHNSSELIALQQQLKELDHQIEIARERVNTETNKNAERLRLKALLETARKQRERQRNLVRREKAKGREENQLQAQKELNSLNRALQHLRKEEFLSNDERSQLRRKFINTKTQRKAASKALDKAQKTGTSQEQENARRTLEKLEQDYQELSKKLDSVKKQTKTSLRPSAHAPETIDNIEPGLREATRQLEILLQEREQRDKNFQAASDAVNRQWFSALQQGWLPRNGYETPPSLPKLKTDIEDLREAIAQAQHNLKTINNQDWDHQYTREQELLGQYQATLHNLMEKGKNLYGHYTTGQKREIVRLRENIARQEQRLDDLNWRKDLEEILPPVTTSFKDSLRVATRMPRRTYDVGEVVKLLQSPPEVISKQSLTPALFVVYSRDKCKRLVEKLVNSLPDTTLSDSDACREARKTGAILPLVTEDERRKIDRTIEKYIHAKDSILQIAKTRKTKTENGTKDVTTIHKSELLDWLRKGVAVHHRGLLPNERKLVEELLEKGLLKVVFGTDTLTVGLDSPFRTVVQWDVKRIGELIDAADIVQTGGRAGRKGRHTEGFYILPYIQTGSPALKFEEKLANYIALITGSPEPIESQLDVSAFQILNMLNSHKPITVIELIRRSLAAYQEKNRKNRKETANTEPEQADFLSKSELVEIFKNTRGILTQLGFLEINGKLTTLGQIAAEIPGENHLLIAKALVGGSPADPKKGLLQTLTPENLAVLLSCLVVEPENVNALNQEFQRSLSEDTIQFYDAIDQLQEMSNAMQPKEQAQIKHNLPAPFINLDYINRMRRWYLYLQKDPVSLQEWNDRGDFFNVLKRTDNLITHLLNVIPSLKGSDLEKSTFQQSLQTVRKRIISKEIRKLKTS